MTTQEHVQPAGKPSRLFFIDHLRAALIILVVLHHVGIVYGASVDDFYYIEPPFNDTFTFLVLLVFALFNQAWFMGALFLIAGYFTPASYDRKGPGSFIKGRLVRLGIPLLLYFFLISPLSAIGYWLMPAELTGITSPLTWKVYPFLLGLGVAWFLALLLIFNFGYALWRRLTRDRTSSSTGESSTPSYLGIAIFTLALALVSYLVRIVIPLDKEVLDFPTLAYLSQYLGLFVIGTIAYRRNWFRNIPGSMGVVGFVAALVATATLFSIAFTSILTAIENASQQLPTSGYGTWQSAVYTLWDSIFAVGMCLAAITFFRRFFDKDSNFGRFLSQQSYAVYIIHIPIIVFLAYALRGITLAPLLKFGLLSLFAVPTCFIVAYVLRKIPGVSKVL